MANNRDDVYLKGPLSTLVIFIVIFGTGLGNRAPIRRNMVVYFLGNWNQLESCPNVCLRMINEKGKEEYNCCELCT